jgi:hypothetical protein
VAKAFSMAYHSIQRKQRLLQVFEVAALPWLQRICPALSSSVYLVEPNPRRLNDIVVVAMLRSPAGGPVERLAEPVELDRVNNIFSEYLFRCAAASEMVMDEAYMETHVALPVRDEAGRAAFVLDMSLSVKDELPANAEEDALELVRHLEAALKEIGEETEQGRRNVLIAADKLDDETRVAVLFHRGLLVDARRRILQNNGL